jgi:hypothetical protein
MAPLDCNYMDKPSTAGKKVLCPCLSGGLYKIAMLQEIGSLDPNYYQYNSCSELGIRAQLANWGVEHAELATMTHPRRPPNKDDPEYDNLLYSRVWNVLRFFPESKKETALDLYRNERIADGATPEQVQNSIDIAIRKCPTKCKDEYAKKRIYEEFVVSN